jgi:AcrR family transcriptional regulator
MSIADRHRAHRAAHGRKGEDLGPIWARPEPGSRRPRYTRDQIATVAVAIADAEGFEAVAMRRVAAELGASPMSLYHYIAGKEDLVALMDDALMAETVVPDDELPADWRQAVATIARRTRAVFRQHPWALAALQGRNAPISTPLSPNAWRHFEQQLAVLATSPLDTGAKLDLLTIVNDFVTGHALRAGEMEQRRNANPAVAEAGFKFGQELLRSGRYPFIEALSRDPAGAAILDEQHVEGQFERGLWLLIDGSCAGQRRE